MLKDSLQSLTVEILKGRLALLDTFERPTRKAELTAVILGQMLSSRCREYFQKLNELEKQAVAEALHAWGGDFKPLRFQAKYGEELEHFTRRSYYSSAKRPLPQKSYLPLFFYNKTIPEDLQALLAAFVPAPETAVIRTLPDAEIPRTFVADKEEAEAFPVKRLTMESVIRHDLPAVLRLVDSGQISVSEKTGLAGAAAVRKLENTLLGGDYYTPEEDWNLERWQGGKIRPIRPFAWPLLLQTGGLAKRNGTKLGLTSKGRKALTEPLAKTVKLLYDRWYTKGMLDEFRRIDQVKGQTGKARRMTPANERRLSIQDALLECPPGKWIAVDELCRYMQSAGHEFEVTYNYWTLYVADSRYGCLGYDDHHGFGLIEARYILAYLFEYLATLGLLDIAYTLPYGARYDYSSIWGVDELAFFSRYDGLLFFRMNPLGAYCLGLTDEYHPAEPEADPLLNLGPDLHITLLREAEPGERLMLEQYAEPGAGGNWRIRPETILKAMEQGLDLALFLAFLRSHSAEALPTEAEQLFSVASERLSAIADGGPARLLQCANSALAGMIAADPLTQPHCLHAGGRTLVIPEKSDKAFRKALGKLGYIHPRRGQP